MYQQSKILVWYQVASQKVILGEASSRKYHDAHSIWRRAPEEDEHQQEMGFRLSLFDDGGREVAGKAISMGTADQLLLGVDID